MSLWKPTGFLILAARGTSRRSRGNPLGPGLTIEEQLLVRWLWDQVREVRERETAPVRDQAGQGVPLALVREVEMAVPRVADRAFLVPVGLTAAVREPAKEQELESG